MWQEVAIVIIGFIVIFYIGRKIYRLVHPQKQTNPVADVLVVRLKI